MKINLRKASHLERDVQTLITDLSDQLESKHQMDEFSKPLDELAHATQVFDKLIVEIVDLRDIVFHIRKAIAVANAQVGVTNLLADKAKTEQNLKMLVGYSKARPLMPLDEIHSRLEIIKTTERSSYHDCYVTTSILSEDKIKMFKEDVKSYKRDLRKIDADLLELNIKTEIELLPSMVTLLQEEGLL